MLSIRKILHPTDFSSQSRPAFEYACSLARDFGAELLVCHVAPPNVTTLGEGMVLETAEEDVQKWTALLEQIKSADPAIRVAHRLLEGDPAEEILRLAETSKSDVIVLGTHGRGWISRLLMGSVAEAVLRKAPCPVVTVKAPFPTDASAPASSSPG